MADATTPDPWHLVDCEGSLEIWREAALRHVTRAENGEITGYALPAAYKDGDLIASWDLSTWDEGQDPDDDARRRIYAEIVRAHNEAAEVEKLRVELATVLKNYEGLQGMAIRLEGERDEARAAVAEEQRIADERRTELLEERDQARHDLTEAEAERDDARDELSAARRNYASAENENVSLRARAGKAEEERDEAREQVRVMVAPLKRSGVKGLCSRHADRAEPGCEVCRDAEIFRAALDGTEPGR